MTQTHAALSTARSALLTAFRPVYGEEDAAGQMRIHLSTERWRAVEPYFTPNMAGVDAAGLGELATNVLSMFAPDVRARLASTVFLTGSPAALPGLGERLANALRPNLPTGSNLRVVTAQDPANDAWRGMAHCSLRPDVWQYAVTNEEYQEWGGERIRRWWGGNSTSSSMPTSPM